MMKNQSQVQSLYTNHRKLYTIFAHGTGYHRAIKKFFYQANYLQSSMHILDAGCGTGLVTKIIYNLALYKNKKDLFFHGFDLTPTMLTPFHHWINKNNITNIRLVQADLCKPEQLPSHWHNFDMIIVSGMLEYIPKKDIELAINNLKNLLKPTGILLLFICNRNWLTHWIIYKWWKANLYLYEEIEDILHCVGFTQPSRKKFPFPYQYLNSCLHIIEAHRRL